MISTLQKEPAPELTSEEPRPCERILFPFLGSELSTAALDAALRLAKAENATLVPAYLAKVPMNLPLESPLPHQAELAMPILEAIEQRAAKSEVQVDSRIERGRTYRHALALLLDGESYDRIVAPGSGRGSDGFSPEDVAWLLDNAEGEIVIFRPSRGSIAVNSAVLASPSSRTAARPMASSSSSSAAGSGPIPA